MAKSSPSRRRRRPQRTCVACHQVQGKSTLMRIVRTADGVVLDERGKVSGRGAYLHHSLSCWQRGLALDTPRRTAGRTPLERALRTRLSADERNRLMAVAADLADAVPNRDSAASPSA